MNTRPIRIGTSSVLLGMLVFFFVPILYNPELFACQSSAATCLSDPSGLESLGYWFFHSGAAYSFEGGWAGPTGGYFSAPVYNLTTFGVLLTFAAPLIVACVALLGPEIVKKSKLSRIGFAAFGASIFIFAVLVLASLVLQQYHDSLFALVGAFYGVSGMLILMHGLHVWPLDYWERVESHELW
ncbi:MAG: hypothetical protein KGI38_01970 [Thaumarchaeota archaeon]|nr:hypothetical protein [Nitrososphaerota archaeon]